MIAISPGNVTRTKQAEAEKMTFLKSTIPFIVGLHLTLMSETSVPLEGSSHRFTYCQTLNWSVATGSAMHCKSKHV